jgi:hypothetical protein
MKQQAPTIPQTVKRSCAILMTLPQHHATRNTAPLTL